MKAKNVKQAMENDSFILKKIYAKGSKQIRVDFEPRNARGEHKHCSFWIDRDYFQRTYPLSYDRF